MAAQDKTYSVAVAGATGLVGTEMIRILEERGFPVGTLVPIASPRSLGKRIEYQGSQIPVQIPSKEVFSQVDICLMSAGGSFSKEWAPIAAEAGSTVIDNSSYWRMDPDVPLVVPEVNPHAIANHRKRGIIANPNCSTIQMVVALAPLHRAATLQRINVSTYQAVSGAGKAAMDELGEQVQSLFNQRDIEPKAFSKRIAFNCLPHIDVFLEDGFTKEEHKMHNETRKILEDDSIGVCATCVRVPVFNGHAESIVAEFKDTMDSEKASIILREAPGVHLDTEKNEEGTPSYPTQIDCDSTDATYVGRLRNDPSTKNSITFWCVADNLRKGAATNAVQIAEILIRDHLN